MSMGMIAVGVIGAGVSLYGANKAAQQQREAMRMQQGYMDADIAFRMRQYEDEKAWIDPLRKKMMGYVNAEGPMHWGEQKDAIEQQFGMAQRQMGEEQARSGLTGSDVQAGNLRTGALKKAQALAGAYNKGMMDKMELARSLLGQKDTMAAAGLVAQGYSNAANMYGGYANQYGQAAAQGWSNAASAIGGMSQNLASRYATNQDSKQSGPTTETNTRVNVETIPPIQTPQRGWTDDDFIPTPGPSNGYGSAWR